MAQIIDNILTEGITGMIGGQIVFRSWNGKTFVYKSPRKPTKQSAIQRENRSKFRRATAFAKNMMKDPVKKAEYQEIAKSIKLPNAYTAAITEYMRKPEILDVGVASTTDTKATEVKVITRKKGFKIQQVEIIVLGKSGNVLQAGKAIAESGNRWKYRTPKLTEGASQIVVKAFDLAGNVAERVYFIDG
jgi:hypothetical protein